LIQANELAKKMQIEMSDLQPILETKAKETEEMMVKIAADQIEADNVKTTISEEEKVFSVQAAEAVQMTAEAQKELDAVLPLLKEATYQFKGLFRATLAKVRYYADPRICVRTVMEAICILAETDITWKIVVALVSNPLFITKIYNKFGTDKLVPVKILNKINSHVESDPNF
jgi:dynein heavy chain